MSPGAEQFAPASRLALVMRTTAAEMSTAFWPERSAAHNEMVPLLFAPTWTKPEGVNVMRVLPLAILALVFRETFGLAATERNTPVVESTIH
ncbi:hypothetical protein D3C71_1395900 [compost metagenome]